MVEQSLLALNVESSIVGRKVVELTKDRLVLDTGEEFTFEAEPDCCAQGGVDDVILVDDGFPAVVTGVEEIATEPEADDLMNCTFYQLTLLGVNKPLATIMHTTDYSNGYYCSSVSLVARRHT